MCSEDPEDEKRSFWDKRYVIIASSAFTMGMAVFSMVSASTSVKALGRRIQDVEDTVHKYWGSVATGALASGLTHPTPPLAGRATHLLTLR